MAQPVLLHAEVAGIGELARDRRHVGGGEAGAERHRGRARRPAHARERADADAVQQPPHLLRRTAAVVAHDLRQRLGEARPALLRARLARPGIRRQRPRRRRPRRPRPAPAAHPWPPARSRAARAPRAADRRARRPRAPPGSATSATRSASASARSAKPASVAGRVARGGSGPRTRAWIPGASNGGCRKRSLKIAGSPLTFRAAG